MIVMNEKISVAITDESEIPSKMAYFGEIVLIELTSFLVFYISMLYDGLKFAGLRPRPAFHFVCLATQESRS